MADVKFYIIIPTYNRVEKLKKAIKSVLNQTYQNFHIIIIDDHSENKNSLKIQEFIKGNNKISYNYLLENKGHAHARNYGLKQIIEQNVWVKYLDDDNIIVPTCLEDINNFVKNKKYDVITSNFKIISENGIKMMYPNYNCESVFNGNLDTCCICHTIELFQKLGGWDEYLYRMADDDFFFKYIPNGNYGYCDKLTAIYYRTKDKTRVTNQVSNLKYVNHIADKYSYFNKKCLIICNNEYIDNVINSEFNIESFMKFDINKIPSNEYDFYIYIKDYDVLNDIFNHYYKTKENMFEIKHSLFIKNKLKA